MSRLVALLRRTPPRRARTRWPSVPGTVLSATEQLPSRVPHVIYAYAVDGVMLTGSTSAGGGSTTACAAGAPVVVYYDPDDPSRSTLEP